MFTELMASGSGGGISYQSGEFTDTFGSATYKTHNVTFDTPFSSVPKVYVRAKWGNNDYGVSADTYGTANAVNVTTTGFTLSYIQGQTSSAEFTFEWCAFVD